MITTFFSCTNTNKTEFLKIKDYFEQKHDYKISEDITKIVVITEGTGCPVCDNEFANMVYNNLTNKNTLILITATGRFVNVEQFLYLENNCFFDWELEATKYPAFTSSRVIYLQDNNIDTTIILDTNILPEQLKYIANRD